MLIFSRIAEILLICNFHEHPSVGLSLPLPFSVLPLPAAFVVVMCVCLGVLRTFIAHLYASLTYPHPRSTQSPFFLVPRPLHYIRIYRCIRVREIRKRDREREREIYREKLGEKAIERKKVHKTNTCVFIIYIHTIKEFKKVNLFLHI